MGILGTILSIVPTVAGVIGNLLTGNDMDYIKFKMYQPSAYNEEPDIYFVKTGDNRIKMYNTCGYPVHISMETAGVESDKGFILEDCGGGLDVTDLIAEHAAHYKNELRLTVHLEDKPKNGMETVSLSYSGRLDRDIEGSVCIGEYASVEAINSDFILIIHSGCTLKEVSRLSIRGEGNEPAHIYENVVPDSIILPLQASIRTTNNCNDTQVITFPNAIASFEYSEILDIEMCLLCEMETSNSLRLSPEQRKLHLAGEDWDFLRKGRCIKEC